MIKDLPDPFLMNDGTRVATYLDWTKRREEIKSMLLYYEYGHMPPAPENLIATVTSSNSIYDGAAIGKRITLCMGPDHKVSIRLGMIIPEGPGPFPVILKNDRELGQVPIAREIVDRGYIVAEYVRHDLDNDNADRSDGVHPLYPDYDWGTLAAWAWGSMRVIDYFMTLDIVDKDRIAFTGHSRGGKTALLACALDERIALVAPNGSGTGGAGSYRILGEGAERLEDILTNFPFWFHPCLGQFIGKETQLPFDQHFLRALVAPRAVVSTDALDDRWANPVGTQHMFVGSQPVFDWLDASNKNGIHFRNGGHAQSQDDWRVLVDFADKVFFDRIPEKGRRFDKLPFPDEEKAFSWTVPR